MNTDPQQRSINEATQRLLKWARDLASYDVVNPDRGMFNTMQYVAQSLAGLKLAVENYDETTAFFAE